LLPFCSSVVVVFGLLNLQRAQNRGASIWTSMIIVSWSSACIFPVLAFFGGTWQPALLWQPAITGGLFMMGQLFTFLAIARGDVSIAAPVLGVKVLLVPAASRFVVVEALTTRIWVAAAIAVIGIVCVQFRDASIHHTRIMTSVTYALLAACSMTMFDLLIQRWAPGWGAGYFLPLTFAFAATFSLAFLPLADRPARLGELGVTRPLLFGALFMAVQAIGMTLALGFYGDATRVNIVYSLRGLWGVIFTWLFARHVTAPSDSRPSQRVMTMRLIGAVLIGISVIISVT